MNKYHEIIERMAAIQYQISLNDKKPKNFGTDGLLYQSEIHFIDAIGKDKTVMALELARKLNITKGAVTQVSKKLLEKGYIKKLRKDGNKKEIYFELTEKGIVAYDNHLEFHGDINNKIIEYLKKLNKDQLEAIIGLVELNEKCIPRIEE
jgi:DNA-binding MarR family transcriptional regulator